MSKIKEFFASKFTKKRNTSINLLPEEKNLQDSLAKQDAQIAAILQAEEQYKKTNDIQNLIIFWEQLWQTEGMLVRGTKWTFRLTDLYFQEKNMLKH